MYDVEEEIARFREYREQLPEFVVDAVAFMRKAQEDGTDILIEGANALMLDIDYGGIIRCDLSWARGSADRVVQARIHTLPAATPGWVVSLPGWPSTRGRSSEYHEHVDKVLIANSVCS